MNLGMIVIDSKRLNFINSLKDISEQASNHQEFKTLKNKFDYKMFIFIFHAYEAELKL